MEKFPLKDLQVSALSTFECYPNIDSLWAVENGMFFLPKQKGDAKDYAFRLKLAEPVEITRADAEAAQAELEATNTNASAAAGTDATGSTSEPAAVNGATEGEIKDAVAGAAPATAAQVAAKTSKATTTKKKVTKSANTGKK